MKLITGLLWMPKCWPLKYFPWTLSQASHWHTSRCVPYTKKTPYATAENTKTPRLRNPPPLSASTCTDLNIVNNIQQHCGTLPDFLIINIKRPGRFKRDFIVLRDNSRAHVAYPLENFSFTCSLQVMDHPLLDTNLYPSDFQTFRPSRQRSRTMSMH
jgi:hypothetical protein